MVDDVINFNIKFLSTPSARRATRHRAFFRGRLCYFYPRPPRGGRRQQSLLFPAFRAISIHALREEGDYRPTATPSRPSNFYPRPPRGGRRATTHRLRAETNFYPRPPRGGRLIVPDGRGQVIDDFYPRPPRGGRHRADTVLARHKRISIHALREEGDPGCHDHCERYAEFLSTPSARRATKDPELFMEYYEFLSTPSARRATNDVFQFGFLEIDFYPRPPRGGRRSAKHSRYKNTTFLSTPSARRATMMFSSLVSSR